ncbi:NifB/NifX family molybdenum-iron cluster-binding protein [Shewanella sp. 125m-7]
MIIAIPMSRDRLATHFTKAAEIAFYDEQQLIARLVNPAMSGGCSAKKAMLNLIQQYKTDIVIVQHIGERMLGKLLDAGISVSKADNSLALGELIRAAKDLNNRLVDASLGRASLNHQKKGGCCGGSSGGCGCSSKPSTSHSLAPRLLKTPQLIEDLKTKGAVQYAGFRSVK